MKSILFCVCLLLPLASPCGEFLSGQTACPTSGNLQVSSKQYSLFQLTVLAPTGNSGTVYLGSSTVSTTTGLALVNGASYNTSKPNPGVDPSTLYFACSNSADKVHWIGSR